MTKWADYGISAVRFNAARTHIDRVQARPDNGDTIGSPIDWSREDVVAAIRRGTTFVSIFRGADGKWTKGRAVFIVRINGIEFIKTTENSRTIDNLDDLPEY